VPRCAASQDHDAPDVAQLPIRQVDAAQLHVAGVGQDATAETVLDGLGLLKNLLEHEVFVTTLLDGVQIPGDLLNFLGDGFVVHVERIDTFRGQSHHVAVVQINNLAGLAHDGGHVAGQEICPFAHANDQGAAPASANDEFRMVFMRHRNAESTIYQLQGLLHCLHQVAFVKLINQMGQNFAVGVGFENMSLFSQLNFQGTEVLNDAVVDQSHVAGNMGMRVDGVGRSVGGPAGVADTARAHHIIGIQLGFQIADLAFFLHHMLSVRPHDGNSRAVIAAVFKAF